MPEFDVGAFIAKLEQMGLRLTTVPLADGRLRVNRWHMPDAAQNAKQIQDLWATHIGDDQGRMDLLAAHLAPAPRSTSGTPSRVPPARFPASSQTIQAKSLR